MLGLYILCGVIIVMVAVLIILLIKKPAGITQQELTSVLTEQRKSQLQDDALQREYLNGKFESLSTSITTIQGGVTEQLKNMREENGKTITAVLETTRDINKQNASNMQAFNETVAREMKQVRTDMQTNLDKIKNTVDEQLQTNLERKLNESFRTVSEQLLSVQRGLGEMNKLASDVGDLRKTLSNVKTRGIWGEVQLGAILSDILSPDQYDTNVVTIPKTTNRVEFAIKLPGADDDTVYLPIDSKFPGDSYNALLDAYDSANPVAVDTAWKQLEYTLMSEGKDIHDKYVSVPYTTEFAIMFLPVEGLYAEAVKHGMVEKLQQKYKVNIAGPTTMAALLNSLQMGFKTLQIQKQSSEVWKILQSSKMEFDKFGTVLTKAQDRLKQTQEELETLVGVRTRQINAKLAKIQQYTPELPEGTTEG